MQNLSNDNSSRRFIAHVSSFGTTQFHLRNPYIVAWWSAAFPGFGHILLSKYIRGFLLVIWEVFINIKSNLNLAMIYSFQGEIERAKDVLNTRWILVYIPVYLFAIWDSYRTTVDINRIYLLAEREKGPFNSYYIGPFEVNYLDKRNPVNSIIWSLLCPGLGELHIHRIIAALFIMSCSVVFFYYSHLLEAITWLFWGNIAQATKVVKPEWLLFLPSIYGFALFDSYASTVENNKLFDKELKQFLKKTYQSPKFTVHFGKKVM